jgi:predicted amidophosphoribosyltransferase
MKYKQDTVTASLLSLLLKNELNSFFQAGSVYYNKDILGPAIGWDTISYIPSIKEHYLKRGFYSTHYIARNLATQLNIPFLKIKFEKKFKKNTKPISIKSRKNKEDKPKFIATLSTTNKICVNKSEIKSILIIDDVITTGASLESIIKSLSKYNLEKIDIISIAQSKRLHRYLFK